MRLVLSDDKKWFYLEYANHGEAEQMKISLLRTIRNTYVLRKKNSRWKGQVNFLIAGNKVKVGMWNEIKRICKKHNIPLKIEGLDTLYNKVDYNYVYAFTMEFTKRYCPHISPRKDQIDAIHRLLMYENCMADLGTSAGKTFIIFMYCLYKRYHGSSKRILIICHDADSVLQFSDGIREYSGNQLNLNVGLIYGGSKVKDDISRFRIVIGNFQALQHRSDAMFAMFDCVIVDEVQKATNATIQKILDLSENAVSKIGLSGTILEDNTADHYKLTASFGPIIARISQKELMDIGAATPVKIEVIILDYPPSAEKSRLLAVKQEIKLGDTKLEDIDLYKMELYIIRNHAYRLGWMCTLISKLVGNTLVLFTDVEGGYGRRIFSMIKKINPSKELYYIDGSIDAGNRDIIKKIMEEGSNKILVATYMTYGTAKSIKNLHNIVLAEPMKGFNVIGQMIGRGMRLHASKDFYRIIDITDNLSIDRDLYNQDIEYTSKLSKQGDARLKLYIKKEFEYRIRRISIPDQKS